MFRRNTDAARDERACRKAWQAKRNERSPVRRPERALVTAIRGVKGQGNLVKTLTYPIKRCLIITTMSSINDLSVQQLRQAANLKEQIEALEKELSQLLGAAAKPDAAKAPKKKGGMSAAGRAKVAAAQKARWAKIRAAKPIVKAAKPAKKKFTMSASAKAKISAAAKARWAKIKAEKK
jgi:hypothetical protein